MNAKWNFNHYITVTLTQNAWKKLFTGEGSTYSEIFRRAVVSEEDRTIKVQAHTLFAACRETGMTFEYGFIDNMCCVIEDVEPLYKTTEHEHIEELEADLRETQLQYRQLKAKTFGLIDKITEFNDFIQAQVREEPSEGVGKKVPGGLIKYPAWLSSRRDEEVITAIMTVLVGEDLAGFPKPFAKDFESRPAWRKACIDWQEKRKGRASKEIYDVLESLELAFARQSYIGGPVVVTGQVKNIMRAILNLDVIALEPDQAIELLSKED